MWTTIALSQKITIFAFKTSNLCHGLAYLSCNFAAKILEYG